MSKRFVAVVVAGVLATAAAWAPELQAQTWPTRPITLIVPFPPEGLAAFHKAEIEKWWPIIRAAGIKVE